MTSTNTLNEATTRETRAPGRSAAIVGHSGVDRRGTLQLKATRLDSFPVTARARGFYDPHFADHEPEPVLWTELSPLFTRAERIAVTVSGVDRPISVIDSTIRLSETGHGNGTWLWLVPAGAPEG